MRTINRDTRKSVSTREIARYSGGAVEVVPRGRVELPTPAFSGPRSTGELPRHFGIKGFYGKQREQKRENGASGEKGRSRGILHFVQDDDGSATLTTSSQPGRHCIDESNSRIQSFFL